MKRERLWRRGIASVAIMVVLLTLGSGLVMGAGRLTVSYNPMPLNVPSVVMKEKGLLEEAVADLGLEVEYKAFLAGYQMTEAMAAGELDIAAVMGGTSTITSYAGGREIQIFAAYGQSPAGFALVTKSDSPLAAVEDLTGKTVGVPVGTEAHFLLAKALEEAGLTLKDIQVANMLVPDAVTALMAGHVEAAVIVEPVLSRLQTQGKIAVLRDGVGLMPGLTVMTVRREVKEQKPEVVAAFLKAHVRSLQFMEEEPEATVELVAKETKLPPELIKQIMTKYTFSPYIGPDLLVGLEGTASFLQQVGVTKEAIDMEGLVDTTILDELEAR
ncbi:MAG: aliphatic sulfonate ABC transporter substrate-binding protein [Firmicutes bacterium]|jgi:sulfonate transport system substrate-binding protein|nr:aliphatic sulfonate ABC transporter substrate-binding protein [Bacillota bacterium]